MKYIALRHLPGAFFDTIYDMKWNLISGIIVLILLNYMASNSELLMQAPGFEVFLYASNIGIPIILCLQLTAGIVLFALKRYLKELE